MGVTVEWMSAGYTSVGIIEAGAQWDGEIVGHDSAEDTVNEGHVGLVFGGDAVTIIEGTPQELREKLLDLTAKLDEIIYAGLPELTPGEPGTEAACQYVFTEVDVARMIERHEAYNARMRELHGDAANISDLDPASLPVVGATCGEDLIWEESVADYRTADEWREDGELHVGGSRYGDGNGDIRLICDGGHEWQVPEINYWS